MIIKYYFWIWILVFIVVVIILILWWSWFVVSPWYRAFTITMGRPNDEVMSEWFHFKKPFIDNVVKMDIRVQKTESEAFAASKDLQTVETKLVVNYSLKSDSVINIYKTIGNKEVVANTLINPMIQEVVKQTTAKYTAEELVTKRNDVWTDLKNSLSEKLSKYWIIISDVSIINFSFSAQFETAIENKVTAEQNAQAEKNKLDIIKYQAQQSIEKAKWEAEANLTNAKANAEAIKIQSQAVQSQWGADYVKLKWIEKWSWNLPNTYMGADWQSIIVDLKDTK